MSKFRVGLGEVGGLSGLLFVSMQLLSQGAQGWGLSKDLNTGWLNSQLVNHVIQQHEIDYCVQIADSRFAMGTIQRQVEAALALWLKPLEELGIRDTAIRAVSCASARFNLKIDISPEKVFNDLGSYQLATSESGHDYSLIKVDSSYVYTNSDTGKTYPIVDFESFVPRGRSIQSMMADVSQTQPSSVREVAALVHADYDAVFWSTYRLLLHETGHSFGLCDTYDSQVQVRCDPAFMSKDQPSSVMRDSNYFYLTADDLAGIKALFARYMK